jgi:endoglucanase
VSLVLAGQPGLSIAVKGNQLVDGRGRPVRLLGVNRSSFEYTCAQGRGIVEGPISAQAIAPMNRWRINAVRIPLNEACWLGLPTVQRDYRGDRYRAVVKGYVRRLHAYGFYVILDLHWNAPGRQKALGQQVMADADHSPAFWRSVAQTFRDDRAVLFDLYNEPHDLSWGCWRQGCGPWAGMQQLVNAVRSTGARQPVMVAGLGWAADLDGWLKYRPRDPGHALVASVHTYNFADCHEQACWDKTIAPVAAQFPVVTGELGENDCAHGYIDDYMRWADAHRVSYLGWTWNTWNCKTGPALIKNWAGAPTPFGIGFRKHLAAQ